MHGKMAFTYCYKSDKIMYYLAFIRTYGKEDGHYKLVKADTKEEAVKKIKDKVGNNKLIDIEDTIE